MSVWANNPGKRESSPWSSLIFSVVRLRCCQPADRCYVVFEMLAGNLCLELGIGNLETGNLIFPPKVQNREKIALILSGIHDEQRRREGHPVGSKCRFRCGRLGFVVRSCLALGACPCMLLPVLGLSMREMLNPQCLAASFPSWPFLSLPSCEIPKRFLCVLG